MLPAYMQLTETCSQSSYDPKFLSYIVPYSLILCYSAVQSKSSPVVPQAAVTMSKGILFSKFAAYTARHKFFHPLKQQHH